MRSSIRYLIGAMIAATLLWTGAAQAASFDCKKAASPIEHRICNDPNLDSYDSQLEAAYLGALDRSIHQAQVTAQQRAWMKERDACADTKCLETAYKRQIETLSKISDEPAICSNSTTPGVNACAAEYSRRNEKELARYLARARQRITQDMGDQFVSAAGKETLAEFDKGQAAWVVYRKAECTAVYDQWSGGTIRGAMEEGCWASLTKSRATEIWETWLSYEDSTPPLFPKPIESR
jgi:uncharacterized protein